jgi:hypothetical protein
MGINCCQQKSEKLFFVGLLFGGREKWERELVRKSD